MRRQLLSGLWLAIALLTLLPIARPASAKGRGYLTGFKRWRGAAGGFSEWQRDGARLAADGALELYLSAAHAENDSYPPGSYHRRNYYNGSSFLVGEALSPVTPTTFSFEEAVASWNADTPAGTWIETQIRARLGVRWTKWYSLGVWASDTSTIERHSVDEQDDADGYVDVDTLVLTKRQAPANALQLKLRLFSGDGSAVPRVRSAVVAFSKNPQDFDKLRPGESSRWDRILPVPECSQMVYPDGGSVWCSATSTAMVLAYWARDDGPCEPRVRAAVEGVYDWVYDGHGNWPFNTAYAALQNLEAHVARFNSLAQAEKWISAGVPVVVSFAWGRGDLTGAALPSSTGHLAVLVGFDATGNPVVNDPAAATDDTVQRTYVREEFESLWLGTRSGTVYLIYPRGWSTPSMQPRGWRSTLVPRVRQTRRSAR